MPHLVDDIARLLASPISRRQALRRAAGVLAFGALSRLGVKEASAASCNANQIACGKNCCDSGTQQCCPGLSSPFCAAKTDKCCGDQRCPSNQFCCTTSKPFCFTKGKKTCQASS